MSAPPAAPAPPPPSSSATTLVAVDINIPSLTRERKFCLRQAQRINAKIHKRQQDVERLREKRARVPVEDRELANLDIKLLVEIPMAATAPAAPSTC
jgi:hypothetical protein